MFSPSRSIRPAALSILFVSALLAAGCGKKTETTAQTTPPADTAASTGGLSDANIAAIVLAANDAEIELGTLAESKGRSADVKAFGKQMATDHGAVNTKAKDLAGRLNLTPEDNAMSNDLKSGAAATNDSLKALTGAAFDRAYIAHEVKYHEDLLSAFDNSLLPAAQNPDLKTLLNDTRPAVVAHLDHAKQLEAQLGSSSKQ
jgi:putative membrane protein